MRNAMPPPPLPTPAPPGGREHARLRVCAAERTHHHPARHKHMHRAHSTHSGGRTAALDQHGGISGIGIIGIIGIS